MCGLQASRMPRGLGVNKESIIEPIIEPIYTPSLYRKVMVPIAITYRMCLLLMALGERLTESPRDRSKKTPSGGSRDRHGSHTRTMKTGPKYGSGSRKRTFIHVHETRRDT